MASGSCGGGVGNEEEGRKEVCGKGDVGYEEEEERKKDGCGRVDVDVVVGE